MRPYVLVSSDFVKTGGMDRANYAVADYLLRSGNEVHLVAHRVSERLLRAAIFHRAAKPANSYFLGGPFLDRLGRHWAERLRRRSGSVLVNGGNCLVGHVNWVHYVHAAYRPKNRRGLLGRTRSHWQARLDRSRETVALRNAALVISNSERTRRDLIERLQVPTERVVVIYYGSDPAAFRPVRLDERLELRRRLGWDVQRPAVLFIGALGDGRKGFDSLFRAWEILCGSPSWDADLIVVGAGADVAHWRRRSLAAGLGQRVRFLGFRRDVPDLVRAADALVAPSRYEAYGLAAHEALCCELPALVSARAGVAERYPAELQQLLIRDPDNAEDVACRLQAWRADGHAWRPSLAAFAARLRTWTWDDMAARIHKCLESAA